MPNWRFLVTDGKMLRLLTSVGLIHIHWNLILQDASMIITGMKVVAAYLLAVLGGNANPSAKDLKVILGSVGAEVEDNMIELLLSGVEGKDLTELLAHGREKLAAVPFGAGGVIAVAAVVGGSTAAPATAAAEPKKEEKVEEKEELDDIHGLQLV